MKHSSKVKESDLDRREGFVDARLFELLRTERERQLTEMIKAMQRVCELVYK